MTPLCSVKVGAVRIACAARRRKGAADAADDAVGAMWGVGDAWNTTTATSAATKMAIAPASRAGRGARRRPGAVNLSLIEFQAVSACSSLGGLTGFAASSSSMVVSIVTVILL
jgi:hypothetical protein